LRVYFLGKYYFAKLRLLGSANRESLGWLGYCNTIAASDKWMDTGQTAVIAHCIASCANVEL